jgi:hypothetical protein
LRRTGAAAAALAHLLDDVAPTLGLGPTEIATVVDRRVGRDRLDAAGVSEHLASPAGLTAQASAFDRRDTIRAWAEAHRNGARTVEVERLADQWLGRADVIRFESGHSRMTVGGVRATRPKICSVVQEKHV